MSDIFVLARSKLVSKKAYVCLLSLANANEGNMGAGRSMGRIYGVIGQRGVFQ